MLGELLGAPNAFKKIIHKTNIYPPVELILYKSIFHALGKKVVTESFFEIELRSTIEVWSARSPSLRYLLLNMNKKMKYLSFF